MGPASRSRRVGGCHGIELDQAFGEVLYVDALNVRAGRINVPQHRKRPRPKVRALRPDAPVALENLIVALMQVEPAQRPASASVVQQRLRQAIGPRQRGKWLVAGMVGALLLVAVIGRALRPGPPQTREPEEDPIAAAVASAAADIRNRLDAGALTDARLVDRLLAAQQSFPGRPELTAVRGTALQSLRLAVTAALAKGQLDAAEQLLFAVGRLEPVADGARDEQLRRARLGRLHGMVRVADVFIEAYEYPNQAAAEPTVAVDYPDAVAQCEAAGKRLCSEAEWQTACAGAGPVLSGALEGCVTPEGIFDLSGNVAEWTSTPVREGAPQRVIRGGSFGQSNAQLTCQARDYYLPGLGGAKHIGLRCCY